MRTFADLFKKYRLRAEFETFAAFGDALAEKQLFYEDSIFSHWQKGTRIPTNRYLLLKIIEIFIERNAIKTLDEANEFLASVGLGYLTEEEINRMFTEKNTSVQSYSLFQQLDRLLFIVLTIVAVAIFSVYSFFDSKNLFMSLAFCINFALSLLVYLKAEKTPAVSAFLFTAFGFSAWCLAMVFYRAAPPMLSLLGAKLIYISPIVIPTAFLLFGLFFPNEKVSKKIIVSLVLCTLIVALVTLGKNTVIVEVLSPPGEEKVEVYGWAFYAIYVFYYPVFFAMGYYSFFRKWLKATGHKKMQLLYILIGMSATTIPSMVTNLLLPALGNVDYIEWGPLFTIFWVFGVYMAITRYRLLSLPSLFSIFKFKF